MPLRASAVLTFERYLVEDGQVSLTFFCADPGPGQVTHYTITLSDAELAAATTTPLLRTLVQTKLDRKFRSASGIATRLDPFIGQTLTVA